MPATPDEALRTSLMGMFEKRRFRNFLIYITAYEEDKPDTFNGGWGAKRQFNYMKNQVVAFQSVIIAPHKLVQKPKRYTRMKCLQFIHLIQLRVG